MAVTDSLLVLEHSYLTVVSPEAAASILWQDAKFAPQAAEQLKIAAWKYLPFAHKRLMNLLTASTGTH